MGGGHPPPKIFRNLLHSIFVGGILYSRIPKEVTDMKRYTFNDGHQITSNLTAKEVLKRMRRLDVLRVLTEEIEDETYQNICKKAIKAYNKKDNFTGIIRLTPYEKEMLMIIREDNRYITEEDKEVLDFYTKA